MTNRRLLRADSALGPHLAARAVAAPSARAGGAAPPHGRRRSSFAAAAGAVLGRAEQEAEAEAGEGPMWLVNQLGVGLEVRAPLPPSLLDRPRGADPLPAPHAPWPVPAPASPAR